MSGLSDDVAWEPRPCEVLVSTRIEGQSKEGYDAMFLAIARSLRVAPHLVAHTAWPVPGGWNILEIWRSGEQADAFYRDRMRPQLGKNLRVKRKTTELHNLVVAKR